MSFCSFLPLGPAWKGPAGRFPGRGRRGTSCLLCAQMKGRVGADGERADGSNQSSVTQSCPPAEEPPAPTPTVHSAAHSWGPRPPPTLSARPRRRGCAQRGWERGSSGLDLSEHNCLATLILIFEFSLPLSVQPDGSNEAEFRLDRSEFKSTFWLCHFGEVP